MSMLEIVTVVLVFVIVIGWYLSYTAARLHRLQTRVEGALAALDAHLVRRAEAAVELANSGLLDPATSLIVASAAAESLDNEDTLTGLDWEEGGLAQRELVESGLTQALRLAFPDGPHGVNGTNSVNGTNGTNGTSGTTDVNDVNDVKDERTEGAVAPHLHVAGQEPEGPEDNRSAEASLRRVLDAHRRVQLARRFYNDAVTDVQRLRRKAVIRGLRLAGHALVPRTVEFDDDLAVR